MAKKTVTDEHTFELTPEAIEERAIAEASIPERERELVKQARLAGYQTTSDPIFFQYQRGAKTEQEWLDAVKAVDEANPYPEAS